MSPLHSGEPGDGPEDDPGRGRGDDGQDGADDGVEFRPPLPPEDRIWRHPSEVAAAAGRPPARTPVATDGASSRRPTRVPDRRTVGVAALSAGIGATLTLGVVAAIGGFGDDTTVVQRNVAVQPVTSRGGDDATVAAISERTAPTVAAVRADHAGTVVAGTAVVYRSDGYLLTNAHLVGAATTIEVRLHGGSSAQASVVGADAATDVAVLHVDAHDLVPAAFGTADEVEVGHSAIVMGTADSGGWATEVSTGVISGTDRRLSLPDGRVLHGMLLLDVPIGPSMGGGPLLDVHGAVVGITSAMPASGPSSDGGGVRTLGVATPVDVVTHVADQLIAHGHARHVWLGVEGTDLGSEQAMDLGIAGGAAVSRVVADSPAAVAGVEAGDVVVAVDGEPVDSMSDLIAALRRFEPDASVGLTVLRDGESVEIDVRLAERQT